MIWSLFKAGLSKIPGFLSFLGIRGVVALIAIFAMLVIGGQLKSARADIKSRDTQITSLQSGLKRAIEQRDQHAAAAKQNSQSGNKWRDLAHTRRDALKACNDLLAQFEQDVATAKQRARVAEQKLAAANRKTKSKKFTPQCVAAQIQVQKTCPASY